MVSEDGLDRFSLRGLAARLGVTAPALYAHVGSKDDLLRALAEVEFGELIDRFDAVDATDPIDRIRALCRVYLDFARTAPERFALMFRFPPELEVARPTGAELPIATKAFAIAATATEEAMAAGRLRPGDPLITSLTVWVAAHGLADVLTLGFDLGHDLEEALIDSVVDTVLRGLAPQPPP